MEHCYIFDYNSSSIFHVELPEDIEDIEHYLCKTYNFDCGDIYFMVTEEPLTIQELQV